MLTYMLDNTKKQPLYEQLYRAIRQDIIDGTLHSREKLPSKRQLAAHLKISPVTVETAYGQLLAEGYITSQPKRGYFVQALEGAFALPREVPEAGPVSPPAQERAACRYDFRTDQVDVDCFPFSTWAKLMRETLTEQGEHLLYATKPQGAYALRAQIARYLYSFRGISAAPEQIIVGAGSEYLVGLLIQLLGRARRYALENPGYPKLYRIFEAAGAAVCPIALDGEGMCEDALRAAEADVVYLTPSHHFPLGVVTPAGRRMALLRWAAEGEGRYLIEDDYDSEFRYASRPIPAMKSMDGDDRVIYINTFAKSLAPSLRIGYMVLPPALAAQFHETMGFFSSTVPSFEQYTLAKFMEYGYFERHINRARNRYRMRRDVLTQALLEGPLGSRLRITGGEAGLHLLVQVEGGMDEEKLVARALEQDIRVYGLSAYYHGEGAGCPPATVLLGYAGMTSGQLKDAAGCLAKAWMQ